MDLGLKDRVAVVAASSKGLGKAVALGLAAEGAKLALCARGKEELERTANEIGNSLRTDLLAQTIDVTVEAAGPRVYRNDNAQFWPHRHLRHERGRPSRQAVRGHIG